MSISHRQQHLASLIVRHHLYGVLSYKQYRNHRALVQHLVRRARHLGGELFPDPRNQDLLDRGVELEWRARVRRRELMRAEP